MALRSGQIASAVDRRDVHQFLAVLPKFVATCQAALDAKAAGTLDEPTCPEVRAPEKWLKTEVETARMVSSELLAELSLDGDAAATALAAVELAQFAPALRDLMPQNFVGTDHASAALGAISWLQQPGVPDGPSLVQVSFALFHWLSASARLPLRLRMWTEVRAAWEVLMSAADPEGAMPATARLEAALDADGADLGHHAALVRAGAVATGTILPSEAEAILARATLM
jgi:hypothetical protein